MQRKAFPTLVLMIALSGAAASSCANRVTTYQAFPSAVDVQPGVKPKLTLDALTSEAAGEAHDNAVEAFGDAEWRARARVCRFLVKMGMKGVTCPPEGADPNTWP